MQDLPIEIDGAVDDGAEAVQEVDSSIAEVDEAEGGSTLALGPDDIEAELHVKDAGMMLVSTVAPDIDWYSGNADVSMRYVKCAAHRMGLIY